MIPIPPRLTMENTRRLLGNPIEFDDEEIVLDFSKTHFSDPIATLFLIRWVETARRLGIDVTPHWGSFVDGRRLDQLPDEHSKWMYYNRYSGFRAALESGYAPPFEENESAVGRYVKYQKLDLESIRKLRARGQDGEARKVVRTCAQQLGRQAFGDLPDVVPFTRCLAELIENAVWYAGEDASCFAMSQLRPLSGPEQDALLHELEASASKRLEIAIVDNGVGLEATLSDNAGVVDPASAIEMAVMPGVSSTAGADRGYGLALLKEAAARGGFMYVATNDDEHDGAITLFEPGKARSRPGYPLTGTLVGISILPELVNLDEIDRQLRQAHGRSHGTLDLG